MLKLSVVSVLLLIGPHPYILHLLTTPLLMTILHLLFIIGSLKNDRMMLLLTTHTP
jgi:hypothetical protein